MSKCRLLPIIIRKKIKVVVVYIYKEYRKKTDTICKLKI